MNKAQVKLELNELITIDNAVYHVAEHPALPGVPYIQRGARGFVIQLKSPGPERYALKYFKLKYRVPDLVSIGKALRQYADLPGLRAAYRTVFTTQTHPELIRRYPALEYGVLMPWLPGTTWFDVITRRVPLSALESLQLAQTAARVLAALEARGLAHCDIAGANVMVDRANQRVELVDIEEMYGATLPRPVEFPAGQDGYQHKRSAIKGQWSAVGDRFGAAVLIAELLGWHNARIRENSADEHYFAASEVQQPDSPRFLLMRDLLRADYAPEIADTFEAAWRSADLADCPPLAIWQSVLNRLNMPAQAGTQLAPSSNVAPGVADVVSGRRSLMSSLPAPAAPASIVPVPIDSSPVSASANPATPPLIAPTTAMRLCPQCGAQNTLNAEFCQHCHYYLRGDRRPGRPAAVANLPAINANPANSVGSPAPRTAINPAPMGAAAPNIVAARRMVGPGQSGQVVQAPEPSNADGRGIIIALVIGFVIAVIILIFVIPH